VAAAEEAANAAAAATVAQETANAAARQAAVAATRAEVNGTFTFAVRASAAYGLEIRKNSVRIDYKSSGFTYT
jgi:hypothetical protein